MMTMKQFINDHIKPSPKWFQALQGFGTGVILMGLCITFIHSVYKGEAIDWSFLKSQLVGILLVNSNTILLEVEKWLPF